LELLEWVNREDLSLEQILLGSVVSNINDFDKDDGDDFNQEDLIGRIPKQLPILPLRGRGKVLVWRTPGILPMVSITKLSPG